jgi:hypothetical protein
VFLTYCFPNFPLLSFAVHRYHEAIFNLRIYWTRSHFKDIKSDSNRIAALLFIKRKKEIEILYKPTPIADDKGNLQGIMGNMFNKGSTPVIVTIDGDNIGLCTTIQVFAEVSATFRPSMPLLAGSIKDTAWEEVKNEIALIVIPNVAPLPFGEDIKSTILNDNFVEEMQSISVEHGFWAKMMSDAHEQYNGD